LSRERGRLDQSGQGGGIHVRVSFVV
jgi:hypothetical protein